MARKRKQQEVDDALAELSGRRETRALEAGRIKGTGLSKNESRASRDRFLSKFYTKLELAASRGKAVTIYVLNLFLLWQHIAAQCDQFAEVLLTISQKDLDIMLYNDEVTPGNVLKPESGTKAHCFYVGAMQMKSLLFSESMWFVAAVVRSVEVKLILGKLAAVTAAICKHYETLRHGHAFKILGQNVFLHGAVRHMLADTPALAFSFGAKTYAGRKVCFKCANIVAKWVSLGQDDLLAGCRDVSAPWSDCQTLTDNEIYEVLQMLEEQAAVKSKQHLQSLESNLGYNHNPYSMWLNPAARALLPPSRCHFDWVHIFYCQGIASLHIFKLREKLWAIGWSAAKIHEFVKDNLKVATEKRVSFGTVFSDGYFGDSTWKAGVSFVCLLSFLYH